MSLFINALVGLIIFIFWGPLWAIAGMYIFAITRSAFASTESFDSGYTHHPKDFQDDYSPQRRVNPASGLPMIGMVDVEGNPFGTYSSHLDSSNFLNEAIQASEINPATGLPMLGGAGGVDVAGNFYGQNRNNDQMSELQDQHDRFNSSFSEFDSGFADTHHDYSNTSFHNDFSSASFGHGSSSFGDY